MPVPPRLELTCEGCGHDLSGVDRRVCPDCGRKFHVPLAEALDLRCPQCGYALTGLTTRICPECSTGFDVRELLRTTRRRREADRYKWADRAEWIAAIVLGATGIVTIFLTAGDLAWFLVALVPLGFFSAGLWMGRILGVTLLEREWSRIALWLGALWAIIGVWCLLLRPALRGI